MPFDIHSALRRLSRIALLAAAAAALLAVLLFLFLQVPPFARFAARTALAAVNPYPGTTVSLGGAGGNWWNSLELRDFSVTTATGRSLIRFDTLRAAYQLLPMLSGEFRIGPVSLIGAEVHAAERPGGGWNLTDPFTAGGEDEDAHRAGNNSLRFLLTDVTVHGFTATARFLPESDSLRLLVIDDLEVSVPRLEVGDRFAVQCDTIKFRYTAPGLPGEWSRVEARGTLTGPDLTVDHLSLRTRSTALSASGRLPLGGGGPESGPAEFRVRAAPLAFRDVHPFVSGVGSEGTLDLDARVEGLKPPYRVRLRGAFSQGGTVSAGGTISGFALADFRDSLAVQVRGLDPRTVAGEPRGPDAVNADLTLTATGDSLPAVAGRAALVVLPSRLGGISLGPFRAVAHHEDRTTLLKGGGFAAGVRLSLDATARLLDPLPSVAARGNIALEGPFAGDLATLSDLATGMRGRFTLSAAGSDLRAGRAEATIDLSAPAESDAFLRSFRLAGTLARREALLRATLATDEGGAGARIRVGFSDSLVRLSADSVRFAGIRLDQLLASDSVIVLTGSARAEAAFDSAGLSVARGEVQLLESDYGSLSIRKARITARHAGAVTGVELAAETDAGAVTAGGRHRAGRGFTSVVLDSLRTLHLDLAPFGAGGEMSSDLTLRARGSVRVGSSADLARLFSRTGPEDIRAAALSAVVDLFPSAIHGAEIEGGRLETSLSLGRWIATAEMSMDTGSVFIDAAAEPYADTARWALNELRTDRLDLAALAGGGVPHTRLTLTARGEARGSSVDDAAGEAVLSIAPSSVGRGMLEGGGLHASLADGVASADAEILVAGGGQARFTGTAGITAARSPFSAEALIDLPDLAPFLQADSTAASVYFELRAGGVSENRIPVEGELAAAGRGRYSDVTVDSLVLQARESGGVVQVERFEAVGTALRLTGSGTIALAASDTGTAASDFRLSGSATDAAAFLALAGMGDAMARNIALDVRVTGPAEVPVIRGIATAARVSLGAADISGGRTEFSLEIPGWDSLAVAEVAVGVEELSIRRIVFGQVAGSARGNLSAVRFGAHAREGEEVAIGIGGAVARGGDSVSVRLDSLVIVRNGRTTGLERPATIVVGPRVQVRDFVLRSRESFLSAEGTIDRRGRTSFQVAADSLRLEAFTTLAGLDRIGGTAGGELTLEGAPAELQVRGSFHAVFADGGRLLGVAACTTATTPSGISLRAALVDSAGRPFLLDATLPARVSIAESDSVLFVPMDGELAGSVRSAGFGLAFFAPFLDPEGSFQVEGLLDADLTLGGSRSAPDFRGYVRVRDGAVDLPSSGVRYRAVTIDAGLEGRRVTLSQAAARTGDGRASAEGTVDFATFTRPELDLMIRAEKFEALRTPAMAAVLDADLRLSGSPSGLSVTGTVSPLEASYRVPESFGGRSEDVVLTDRDWQTLQERFGIRRPGASTGETPQSDLYALSSVDLRIVMTRNVWIRSRRLPRMEVELGGNLRVRKPVRGSIAMEGSLDAVPGRSFVEELGKRFKLVEGKVELNGEPELATVRVVADYDLPSQDRSSSSAVRIRLTATMQERKLTVGFSSDPPMEESEIITFLATGQSTNAALASAGATGSLGTALALEQVVGTAEAITEEKLPLDVFQIQQDGARGVTIVAGTYVTPDTYLGIRQPIELNEDNRTSGTSPNVIEFELEQQIMRWLLFNVQGGVSDLLAFLRFRHTY